MRLFRLLLIVCLLGFSAFSQEDTSASDADQTKSVEEEAALTDKEAFEAAIAIDNALIRIEALKTFVEDYPESTLRIKALESLASARATAGDIKLRAEETAEGVRLFKAAVSDAPEPLSDDLFSKVLVNIPTNLFLMGQRNAAFDIAEMLEVRTGGNQKQILRLATFYIGIKYATGVRRLAEKAIELNPEETLAYQTLGIAQRLGFDLAGAEVSYIKALELDPGSLSIRQSLGELTRSLGKSKEAENFFNEILKKEPSDIKARTGLILSLFEQNKREEAEAALIQELNENPTNAFVMIGAANWYVANGEPQLAVDHATQAISVEKSAVWAYIVMARGLMKQNKPLEAERTLLAASRFSTSPTLSYELALTRVAAGFYREAVVELDKHFVLENGKLVTSLDGRIGAEADSFSDLVALERKSVLFSPEAGYDSASDTKLKELFLFERAISQENADDEAVDATADSFVAGSDRMKTFRQIYASNRLLDAGKSTEMASRMAADAVGGVESSMETAAPAAAVLADQLYEGREAAAKAGRVLIIPQIEKPTLVMIMRGRIEELAGRSLIAAEDYAGAEVRLKRAVSVLPKNSAWWRSSMWRLGTVYEKRGNDTKALESYAASYSSGEPSETKRNDIAGVYTRVNGSLDGFDEMLAGSTSVENDPASLFIKTTSAPKNQKPETGATPEPGDEDVTIPAKGNADIPTAESGVVPEAKIESKTLPERNFPDGVPVKKELPEDLNLSVAAKNPEKIIKEVPAIDTGPTPGEVVDEAKTDPPVVDPAPKEAADETKTDLTVDPAQKEAVDETKTEPPVVDPAPKEIAEVAKSDSPVIDPASKEAIDETSTDLPENPDAEQPAAVPPSADGNQPVDDSLEEIRNRPVKLNSGPDLIDLGAARPRIVPADRIRPLPAATKELTACEVVTSQDSISIIANGGSFGIVIGLKNYENAYVLRAVSLSPKDISIVYEPDIGSVDGRAFFVIKSISENTGEFKVSFETPCGTKLIAVDVH